MTEPHRVSKEAILKAWLQTKQVNHVPCIYDFAERILQLKEAKEAIDAT